MAPRGLLELTQITLASPSLYDWTGEKSDWMTEWLIKKAESKKDWELMELVWWVEFLSSPSQAVVRI